MDRKYSGPNQIRPKNYFFKNCRLKIKLENQPGFDPYGICMVRSILRTSFLYEEPLLHSIQVNQQRLQNLMSLL